MKPTTIIVTSKKIFINTYTSVTYIFVLSFFFGCAAKSVNIHTPLSLDTAVRIAADKIFKDGQMRLGPMVFVNKPLFVFEQIIDSDSGEANITSKKIVEICMNEAQNKFPFIHVEQMNSNNILNAKFVVAGVITQEFNDIANDKTPHLYLSLVDVRSGQIVSSVDVWIADRDLDFEPTPVYKDSPMYLKDDRVAALIATAKAEAGSFADKQYFDTLETSALLDEASSYYDNGEYLKSLGLYAKAAERTDGKVMRTFAGLYQNFMKIGKDEEAKLAFYQLLDLGISDNNLSVKFLFKVDSIHFLGTKEELREYALWLREIANILAERGNCIEVVGHASKSGSFEYNKQLSLKRSTAVLNQLAEIEPSLRKQSKASGRGFTENIIGTGTDDYRDAIDRRVEFKIINCDTL